MIDFAKVPASGFAEKILQGDVVYLAKAITLLESSQPEHQLKAEEILQACMPHSGKALRIGVTGPPGAGKSTLIEALGENIVTQGNKLAILSIDPSSRKSKGSILGDKTRMENISKQQNVFIRPSPAGETLGGVAGATMESIILLEAAGYNIILIETVGVGQSETEVSFMTDVFFLVLLAGTGDELQGMKRGIMELADIICINKADGANLESAKQAQVAFRQAMQLFPPQATGWRCPVELCSAKEKTRIDILWNCIRKFEAHQKNTGAFTTKRNEQSLYWFYLCLKQNMYQYIFQHGKNAFNLHNLEGLILEKKILPRTAAKQALEILR